MRTRGRSCLSLIVLLILIVTSAGRADRAARAQGGLSREQMALLERVFAAREHWRGYSSYVEEIAGSQTRALTIGAGDTPQEMSTVVRWERTATVLRLENGKNIASTLMATVENAGTGPGGRTKSTVYIVRAEIRLIDGKLYVRAEYLETVPPDFQPPKLPEGWVLVKDLRDWPAFENLSLEDFVDEGAPFDNREAVLAAVSDVSSEAATLDDGRIVDIITVTLDSGGVRRLFGAGPLDPFMSVLMENLNEESEFIVSVTVDADNNLLRLESSLLFSAGGLDASALPEGQFPARSRVDFAQGVARTETYRQINEPFEPAAVPEGLAP